MSRLTAYVSKMDRKLLADAEERKAKAFTEPVLTVPERLKLEHLLGRFPRRSRMLSIERSRESEVVLLDAADALHSGVKQYDRLLLAQRALRKLKESTCRRVKR